MKIDYDRGVTHRVHPSGVNVYMYKDQPGVFLNAFGKEVAPELARGAGFDVDRLLKEKAKRERMSEAQRIIEREFSEDAAAGAETVKKSGDYEVKHLGFGRYALVDPDGNRLNARPLTKEEAFVLLDQMAPKAGDSKEEE